MNSLYNHALKQSNALQRDINKFASGQDASVGLQGQISVSFSSFQRSIDDYENIAKREMVAVKKETALTRVTKFRHDLREMKTQFETIKRQQENQQNEQNRDSLLARRPNKTSAPEYPYQPMSRLEAATRDTSFNDSTESQLDDFITQAHTILENLTDQHSILKKTQKKLLDAANTLGLSQNVIRYIERRTSQDKWIFFGGVVITVLLMWAIAHYFG
ncbi:hypothetical protein J3Q64DRAFT_1228685 [Phycomyces blakesleeanus]|uniref:Protein transport protein BOS1 n=2 Tax=Phycomyces blakesleeanus TaxID=4837 RepID=A0ABR3B9M0_PHYBL